MPEIPNPISTAPSTKRIKGMVKREVNHNANVDAIKAIKTPVVEVHLSNVFARESFRHESFLTPVCKGCISGFGMQSYKLAVQSFI